MAKQVKATAPAPAPAPAPAALTTPPAQPKFAAQAASLPKGQRGKPRHTYPGMAGAPPATAVLVPAGTLATHGKQGIVAAYLQANPQATYTALHAHNGSAARNAWRKGWVTAK